MAHQILDEIDQSMNLSFMNRSLEEKFMRLADLVVIDQSIYMGNNVDQNKMIKERKKYSLPKVKARNFLMGISYKRLANKDLANKPFITDCFSFILMYMNPFSLERKFDSADITSIKSLWDVCLPIEFFNYLNLDEILKN